MKHIFCPLCGERLGSRVLGDEGAVPYCERCGRPFFDSFSTCIIAAVVNPRGELAVLTQSGGAGRYRGLVAGYVKPGESAEETACREIKEELGLSVCSLAFERTYWFERGDQLMIGFIARTEETEFALSGEIEAAEWLPAAEAQACMRPGGPAWQIAGRLAEQSIASKE